MVVKYFFIFVLNTCFLFSFAQKKKDIKKLGIKTITSTQTTGTKTLKDSQQTYDSFGRLIIEVSYNDKGELLSTIKYKYNVYDDVTEEAEYNAKNELLEKKNMKYNSLAQKTEEIVTDKFGKQVKKSVYSYNSKGLRIERKIYDSKNNLISTKKTVYGYK